MAVNAEFVRELIDGRQCSSTESERSHTRQFHVRLLAGSMGDGPNGARVADDGLAQVPSLGAEHPEDAFARVINLSASSMGDLRTYAVTVEYSTRSRFAGFTFTSNTDDQDYQIDDPLSRPWTYSFGLRVIEKPVERAYRVVDDGFQGDAGGVEFPMSEQVLNSAGQPYDPPLIEEDHIITMTVGRYEPATTYSPLKGLAWANVINSKPWTMATNITWPKWTAKCVGISSTSEFTAGEWWWSVRYDLEFRWDGWTRSVLDAGWTYIENGKRITATDDLGEPAAYPVLLNGSGAKLPDGGAAVFRKYLTKRTRDFADLFDY